MSARHRRAHEERAALLEAAWRLGGAPAALAVLHEAGKPTRCPSCHGQGQVHAGPRWGGPGGWTCGVCSGSGVVQPTRPPLLWHLEVTSRAAL